MNCAKSTAPDHPNLEVTKLKGAPKARKYHLIPGCSPEINFRAYNTDVQALEMAVKERVFFVKIDGAFRVPQGPSAHAFDRLKNIARHFSRAPRYVTRQTYQQYVDTCPPHKRAIYRNAKVRLEQWGFRTKLANVEAFIKFEKLKFTRSKVPVPRLISTRKPDYHLELGTYIRPIEKIVYTVLDSYAGSKAIMKGCNMAERGKIISGHWFALRKPCAQPLDIKRMDQHVSVAALRWEQAQYRKFFPKDKLFKKLLRLQLRNKCSGYTPNGKVKYVVTGKRESGDVNTSLGANILTASIVFAFLDSLEIVIRVVVDGDDCQAFMEQEDLPRYRAGVERWFGSFGFTLDLGPPVFELEKVSFCQAQPVFDGEQYVMIRDPHISITKDCISLKPLENDKVKLRWCAAIGLGGVSMTGGIPVVQNFYNMLVRSSKGAKPLDDSSTYKYTGRGLGMERQLCAPAAESRYSFYLAFGIPPDAQIVIEDYYDEYQIGKVGDDGPNHIIMPYL